MAETIKLLPQHAKMLEASAIDPKVAEARGYKSVGKMADLKRLGFSDFQRIVPTLLVPIWNVNGEIGLYHHRPDAPRMREGKTVKYEFPAGRHMVVDVHPSLRDKVRDPHVPLFITEGVKKADAAISKGLCCAGVIGTWNWRGTNEHGGKTALPDWDGIALKDSNDRGRETYIVYDSDVMVKRQVCQALVRLSEFLKSRGARVHYIYLPHGSDGAKLGLDDYLALGHSVEDLMQLATTELRQPEMDAASPEQADHPYEESTDGIFWLKPTGEGTTRIRLTNFRARITSDETEDDGAETRRAYEIEASLNGRTERFSIPAATFPALNWASERLGVCAIVEPGFGLKDRARAAIQSFSRDATRRNVYTHIGWRKVDGRWAYLHSAGAVGLPSEEHVSVRVQQALSGYLLPAPPQGIGLTAAVRASLGMLNLGTDTIVVPLLAAVYRSVLGGTDYSIHLSGQTGVFKSELAALAQQHFGPAMDSRRFPADWSSTDNYLEAIAFYAKDAILTIDELVPRGSGIEVQKLWSKVDRVLRGQGNNAGRGRMRADGTLPPPKPPRGTIVSTGEEIPPGQSLNARVFVLEVSEGDIPTDRLSACQKDAGDGLFAGCMAGYLEWLAPQYDQIQEGLKKETRSLRDQVAQAGQHRRTAGITADLVIGFHHFVRFAREAGAVTESEAVALSKRAWEAIASAVEQQAHHQGDAEPTRRFLSLLSEAIASGKAHFANLDGGVPADPAAWGWRRCVAKEWDSTEAIWHEQGDRIGWIDGEDVFVLPAAAYQCAKRLGGESGDGLVIQLRTLSKRLRQHGLLASHGGERGAVIRKTVERRRQEVLHLSSARLMREETAQTAHSTQPSIEPEGPSTTSERNGPKPWAVSQPMTDETAREIGPSRGPNVLADAGPGRVGPFGPFPAALSSPVSKHVINGCSDRHEPQEVWEL